MAVELLSRCSLATISWHYLMRLVVTSLTRLTNSFNNSPITQAVEAPLMRRVFDTTLQRASISSH